MIDRAFTAGEWLALAGLTLGILLLVYTYVGYPALMALLARLVRARHEVGNRDGVPYKRLSIILCVHNEAARLPERLGNLLLLEWPFPGEILVVCDGCTDSSAAVAAGMGDARIRVIELPVRSGKPTGINAAVAAATGDVLVFCDARQRYERGALRHLVQALRSPGLGAVSGLLGVAPAADGRSAGFDRYWSLERLLRKWESVWDSTIGCTGAIYAVRRDRFVTLPADTLLDDVVVPMQVIVQGWRVGYCEEARAWDPQPLTPELEARRKLRTLAGNFQMMFRHPAWLNPLKNRTWWQLISHKYLRVLSPWMLLGIVGCTAVLAAHALFLGLLIVEAGMIMGAMAVLKFPRALGWFPGARLVTAFAMVQIACVQGLVAYLRCRQNALDIWRS